MRRSKAPLAFMEQILMILVFAIAAALCVQVFVKCALGSREIEAQNLALSAAQTISDAVKVNDTETLARYGIDFVKYQDIDSAPLRDGRDFESAGMSVSLKYGKPANDYLWTAVVSVFDSDGKELTRLDISGQKGGAYGET